MCLTERDIKKKLMFAITKFKKNSDVLNCNTCKLSSRSQ